MGWYPKRDDYVPNSIFDARPLFVDAEPTVTRPASPQQRRTSEPFVGTVVPTIAQPEPAMA